MVPTPKRIANILSPHNGDNTLSDNPAQFHNGGQIQADSDLTEPSPATEDDSDVGTDQVPKKRREGDRKDRNAGIKLVGDIDFVPSGKQSLKAFFALKAPNSDMDQILVLCHFLQYVLQSTSIGPGHILSGYRHIGKPVPKDLKQTIRNMRDKKAWINFSDIENIRLSTGRQPRCICIGKENGDVSTQ